MTINLAEWQGHAHQALSSLSESPTVEAQVLLAHATGQSRAWVLSHPETILTPEQQAVLDNLLERIINGVPLPYLIGEQEFFALPFRVTPDVLIPRPETELLIEHAAAWLKAHPGRRRCADIGTGSGCIAVSLATHVADVNMLAVDRSRPALLVAQENARRNGVSNRIEFVQADLLEGLSGPFDLICANLPYIPSKTLSSLPVRLHEPRLALDGGPDGLDVIRRLLVNSVNKMAPGGLQLYEIEYRQAADVAKLARLTFPTAQVNVIKDLAGYDRLAVIELNE